MRASAILDRVDAATLLPDSVWSKRFANRWMATMQFVKLLVHWGRFRLGVIRAPISSFGSVEGSAEEFCVELLRWRHAAPFEDAWPDRFELLYSKMARFDRYKTMKILEHSRILEPNRQLDAIDAYLERRDLRASWPVRVAEASAAHDGDSTPAQSQRRMVAGLIAAADSGWTKLEAEVSSALGTWTTAAEGASSRNTVWSLGHIRLADAVVFSAIRAAQKG